MKLAITAPKSKSRISLTPLIDVVFILLLFFMLTSTFSDRFVLGLNSPVAASEPKETDPEILRIKMTQSNLSIGGKSIQIDKLDKALSETSDSVTGVLIEIAPGVVLEDTVFVMDKLKKYDLGPTSLVQARKAP